jgi:hypothetical protein
MQGVSVCGGGGGLRQTCKQGNASGSAVPPVTCYVMPAVAIASLIGSSTSAVLSCTLHLLLLLLLCS